MADINLRYDHPAYITRGSAQASCAAGTVNTVAARFKAFAAMKIKAIRGHVVTAGTHDDSAITVYHGTTSVGAFANGTQTALAEMTALTDVCTMTRGGYLEFKRSNTNGATMASHYSIEYELVPGAALES
jgi:hypothetical protein